MFWIVLRLRKSAVCKSIITRSWGFWAACPLLRNVAIWERRTNQMWVLFTLCLHLGASPIRTSLKWFETQICFLLIFKGCRLRLTNQAYWAVLRHCAFPLSKLGTRSRSRSTSLELNRMSAVRNISLNLGYLWVNGSSQKYVVSIESFV